MNFSLELIFFMLCHPVTSKQPHKIVQILVGHPLYQNGPFLGNTRTKASNSSLICLRLTLGGGRVWKQWSFQASTYCFSVKLHQPKRGQALETGQRCFFAKKEENDVFEFGFYVTRHNLPNICGQERNIQCIYGVE